MKQELQLRRNVQNIHILVIVVWVWIYKSQIKGRVWRTVFMRTEGQIERERKGIQGVIICFFHAFSPNWRGSHMWRRPWIHYIPLSLWRRWIVKGRSHMRTRFPHPACQRPPALTRLRRNIWPFLPPPPQTSIIQQIYKGTDKAADQYWQLINY